MFVHFVFLISIFFFSSVKSYDIGIFEQTFNQTHDCNSMQETTHMIMMNKCLEHISIDHCCVKTFENISKLETCYSIPETNQSYIYYCKELTDGGNKNNRHYMSGLLIFASILCCIGLIYYASYKMTTRRYQEIENV